MISRVYQLGWNRPCSTVDGYVDHYHIIVIILS